MITHPIVDHEPHQVADVPVAECVLIEFGGNDYTVPLEMAEIFLRLVIDTVGRDDERLIPLRHNDGIELLLVSASSPLRIGSC